MHCAYVSLDVISRAAETATYTAEYTDNGDGAVVCRWVGAMYSNMCFIFISHVHIII